MATIKLIKLRPATCPVQTMDVLGICGAPTVVGQAYCDVHLRKKDRRRNDNINSIQSVKHGDNHLNVSTRTKPE